MEKQIKFKDLYDCIKSIDTYSGIIYDKGTDHNNIILSVIKSDTSPLLNLYIKTNDNYLVAELMFQNGLVTLIPVNNFLCFENNSPFKVYKMDDSLYDLQESVNKVPIRDIVISLVNRVMYENSIKDDIKRQINNICILFTNLTRIRYNRKLGSTIYISPDVEERIESVCREILQEIHSLMKSDNLEIKLIKMEYIGEVDLNNIRLIRKFALDELKEVKIAKDLIKKYS